MKKKHKKKIDKWNIILVCLIISTIGVFTAGIIKDNIRAKNDKIVAEKDKTQQTSGEIKDSNTSKCVVTFIDDDGMSSFVSKMKPVLDNNNIKSSLAIIGGQVGKDGHMSLDTLKNLENEGFEINSHSFIKELHTISNETDLDEELTQARKFLEDNNFKSKDIIIYPTGFDSNQTYNGRSGEDTIEHVKKYFKYGFNAWGTNKTHLNNYMIGRVDFNKDIKELESQVDNSVNNKTYLVFMTHSWMQEFDAEKLDDLIEYIKSKDIKILTASEALKELDTQKE